MFLVLRREIQFNTTSPSQSRFNVPLIPAADGPSSTFNIQAFLRHCESLYIRNLPIHDSFSLFLKFLETIQSDPDTHERFPRLPPIQARRKFEADEAATD